MAAQHVKLPTAVAFAFSSTAPMMAVVFTNPFEVMKVRIQIQGEGGKGAVKAYKGTWDCFNQLVRKEGVLALQKGLSMALAREGSKNLFRIGLYNPVLSQVHDRREGPPPAWKRMLVGGMTGMMGAFVCNPFEVIKTRIQSQGMTSTGTQHNYLGVGDAFTKVYRKEGIRGMYKGADASIIRSGMASAVNIPTMHMSKEWMLRNGAKDNSLTDMISGFCAAITTAVTSNPVDVVRTRLYNQAVGADGRGLLYRNFLDGARKIMMTEGPRAFFNGVIPGAMRLGPHLTLTFIFIEQMNRVGRRVVRERQHETQLVQYFKEFVPNDAGEIPKSEILRVLEEAHPYDPSVHGSSEEAHLSSLRADVKRLFEVADSDGNDRLSFDEFRKISDTLHLEMRERNLRRMFASIDADKSNNITYEELRQALMKYLPPHGSTDTMSKKELAILIEAYARQLFDEADLDKNGALSFEEFRLIFVTMEDFREEVIFQEWAKASGIAND